MARLKRELSLFSATMLGVAIIVGAGIYALIGRAAGIAGDAAWLSFVVSAVVAGFTGLSYAELSSMFPRAGSSYTYIRHAFKNDALAFLAGWLIAFELIFSVAAVALALAGYAAAILPVGALAAAVASIAVFSAINMLGIRESERINNVLVFVEVGGLVAIIALGFLLGARSPNLAAFDFGAVAQAAGLVFFAYIGFEAIAVESEETRVPRKTIPRAILLAVGITAVLYSLTAIAAAKLVPPEVLASSSAPLKEAVSAAIGPLAGTVLAVVAIISAATTILVCLVTGSRLLYGMAREGSLPGALAEVNRRFRTPHYAVLAAGLLAVAFLAFGDIRDIAELTNFGALVAFFMVNAGVVKLRLSDPRAEREFRIPFSVKNVPVPAVLGAATCVWLLLQLSTKILGAAAILLLVGAAAYWLGKKNKK